MTTPTLEELARKHGTIFIEEKSPGIDRVAFTFEELRALIKDVVGDPVAYAMFDTEDADNKCAFLSDDPDLEKARLHPTAEQLPLHALKVTL